MSLFYVIDGSCHCTTYNEENDENESFTDEPTAIDRAKALAKEQPGTLFYIAAVTHIIQVHTSEPTVAAV